MCVETRSRSTKKDRKRPDARYLGTQKLLPMIKTRLMLIDM